MGESQCGGGAVGAMLGKWRLYFGDFTCRVFAKYALLCSAAHRLRVAAQFADQVLGFLSSFKCAFMVFGGIGFSATRGQARTAGAEAKPKRDEGPAARHGARPARERISDHALTR